MKFPFKIREVKPRIFLFEFSNNYDMCMHFLRYQEFYESPSPKFRGKSFSIFDFMKWQSFKYGKGVFTYPGDWDGFNLPSNIIWDVWFQNLIPDRNAYDHAMYDAWKKCNELLNRDAVCPTKPINKFYIIGTVRHSGALNHEIAHGLFYLYPEYKKEMTRLVKELNPEIREAINLRLKKLGYTTKVYIDEIQAYMATGLTESFGSESKTKWQEERKPFAKFYKKFLRTLI